MLDDIFRNNRRWSAAQTAADPEYFRSLANLQAPEFFWIGCSDSRVPANQVAGLQPGEVFVHRNVANVVHSSDMNLLSALEFAIEALGVRHVIVCGHYGCGGVKAASRTAIPKASPTTGSSRSAASPAATAPPSRRSTPPAGSTASPSSTSPRASSASPRPRSCAPPGAAASRSPSTA
jgi:carbonic anhydrase